MLCLFLHVFSQRGVNTTKFVSPILCIHEEGSVLFIELAQKTGQKLRHECLKSKACVSLQLVAGKTTNGEKREEKNVEWGKKKPQ